MGPPPLSFTVDGALPPFSCQRAHCHANHPMKARPEPISFPANTSCTDPEYSSMHFHINCHWSSHCMHFAAAAGTREPSQPASGSSLAPTSLTRPQRRTHRAWCYACVDLCLQGGLPPHGTVNARNNLSCGQDALRRVKDARRNCRVAQASARGCAGLHRTLVRPKPTTPQAGRPGAARSVGRHARARPSSIPTRASSSRF